MPITMPVSIAIILGPDATSAPPPHPLNFGNTILVTEIPAAQARAFTLAEIAYNGTSLWQTPLSLAQSQKLVGLLAQIPNESMSAPARSFDGVAYNVHVRRKSAAVTFTWGNEDWRYDDDAPTAQWEAVAALAEYVKALKDGKAHT